MMMAVVDDVDVDDVIADNDHAFDVENKNNKLVMRLKNDTCDDDKAK